MEITVTNGRKVGIAFIEPGNNVVSIAPGETKTIRVKR